MAQLARFEITRRPDVALGVDASTKGWSLLPAARSGQSTTESPAGLLLTPAQVEAIPPLTSWPKNPGATLAGVFDALHDQLNSLFLADDVVNLDKTATAFLVQHPPMAVARRPELDQRIYQFFELNEPSVAASQALDFFASTTEQDRATWFRAADARIDLTKAQALAVAVSGISDFDECDLLGSLRSDLAFSVLAACVRQSSELSPPAPLPVKYVSFILSMAVHLPHFVFQINPCGKKVRIDTGPIDALSGRLSRLADYETKMKAVSAAAQVSEGSESVLPANGHHDDCDCTCDDPPCKPINPCCVDINYYVTDLLTLKAETHCYKPSDIAYIENVAPYETRIRSHGFVRTVTESSEDETNTSRTEQRDHQVTDRFDLQKEIQNSQAASLDVDAKLSGKIYGQKYELNTSASLSKESAYREARDQLMEVVDKATLNIQVQTRKLRTRTVTTETTEQNKHKFKNTSSDAAVAKYFWVTQEKKGQVFSSGLRMTVDLLIPSPSLLFQHMEKIKRARGFTLKPPVEPKKPTLAPRDITPANYLTLASTYGLVDFDAPPAQPPVQYFNLSVSKEQGSGDVTIPSGYTATLMVMTGFDLNKNFFGFARITLIFGGGSVEVRRDIEGNESTSNSSSLNERNSGPAVIDVENATKKSYIAAKITLTPDPVDLSPWQLAIYKLIMAKYADDLTKYEAKLADYNEALRAYNEAMDEKIRGRHPFACEEIMRTELKRSAIFMMCGEFDWPDVMNLKAEPCGMPWPNRKASDIATNNWYFFDRAFDWNMASFTFFDYFRNPMCKWVDAYEPDEPNFLFKAFLRAGYARIQVPVSPGMELDAVGYLKTGKLWGTSGTKPLDPNDPRWVSVITEIKHSYDCQQNDREGYVEAYADPSSGTFDSRLRVYTDRYWKVSSGAIDSVAIGLDLDRQIFVDGIAYRIVSIVLDPTGPAFDPSTNSTMQWIIGLERRFEGEPYIDPTATVPLLKPYKYAVGARFVGSPFYFELPTDLIWIGDQGDACLPCYPIDCTGDDEEGE